ncbi:branched-chain amino acid transport system II carrier protein [Staphylococcus massiliensis]|uniref:YkvI family membrane protein n=1 Tax=Staphylococcus massiliensis TaxID=555791 RepID=UPI001EDE8FC4|nr:branched-chain amino acid transport system II carrier protein [Staphylococcus massiliensis]MCG3401893.1 branched-chain amino acid transport system II carrier protein [Staphylococcus massiliensis]
MTLNKEAIKIGFAYVGVVVGAGFSTGQEVKQFFADYGLWSYIGVIISGLILSFIGRQVAKIGTGLDADNHQSTLEYLFGKAFGRIIDYLLIICLLGISITMIAGAGSTFKESYGVPTWLGALIMCILIFVTLLMDFNKIVRALGFVTPFLIIMVVLIAAVFLFKGQVSLPEVNSTVKHPSIFKGILNGFVYGGLAFSVGFTTLIAIGGDASRRRISGSGALFGGIIYTILLALINFALQSEYPSIKSSSIPTLTLADSIHPIVSTVLSIIMLLVMYNTILGLSYSIAARFTKPYSKKYYIFITVLMLLSYGLSFFGFEDLIKVLYPTMGWIGLIVIVGVLVKYFMRKKENKKFIA